jgi:acetoacetyl-CoA synthetase
VQRGASSRKLFCLPGLGGVALQFRPLAPRLRTNRSILAVEVHQLDAPASFFGSLEETAAAVAGAIRRVQPEGPYAVLGYSYGGNLGVEVVRCLIADGQLVELAAILAATTPDATRRPTGLRKLATHLRITKRLTFGEAVEYIRLRLMRKLHLASQDLVERVVMVNDRRHVRCLRLAPPPVSDPQRRIEAVAEAGLRAVQRYRPLPFDGSIVLLHPTRLPDWVEMADPTGTCGWGAVCERGVETINLPFGHWGLFVAPGVDALAATLNRLLERVDGPHVD